MPAAKRRLPTKFDKERTRQDVKLLVFAGYSVREAARLSNVNEDTACKWSAQEGWQEELARIKSLMVNSSANGSTAEAVAFDLAKTNKQSRAALAQIANLSVMKKLKHITDNDAGHVVMDDASDFASMTKATAQIAGDWDEQSGSKFAVSLNLNAIVQGGGVRPVPPGYTVIDAEGNVLEG